MKQAGSERVLITGGAGMVATVIRPFVARLDREVTLLDIVSPPGPLAARERFVHASITDLDAVTAACTGADLVIHLGGHSSERPWRDILETNIHGAYSVLEGAHRAGVRRVLLASSIHAVGYARAIDARRERELLPRPDSYYGVSKVAVEALGRLYADRFGMSVVSVRLGTVEDRPSNARSLSTWASPGDLARLVDAVASLDAPGGHVIWGVSANARRWTSLEAGLSVGFSPQDDAEVFAAEVGSPPPMPLDSRLAGAFTDTEHPLGGN